MPPPGESHVHVDSGEADDGDGDRSGRHEVVVRALIVQARREQAPRTKREVIEMTWFNTYFLRKTLNSMRSRS